jgi:hypothetical protein
MRITSIPAASISRTSAGSVAASGGIVTIIRTDRLPAGKREEF